MSDTQRIATGAMWIMSIAVGAMAAASYVFTGTLMGAISLAVFGVLTYVWVDWWVDYFRDFDR